MSRIVDHLGCACAASPGEKRYALDRAHSPAGGAGRSVVPATRLVCKSCYARDDSVGSQQREGKTHGKGYHARGVRKGRRAVLTVDQPELLPSVPTRHHCTSDSGMWYLAEMSFASACGPESVTGGVRSPDLRRKPVMRRLRCDLRPAERPTVSRDFPYGPRSMNMGDMLPDPTP